MEARGEIGEVEAAIAGIEHGAESGDGGAPRLLEGEDGARLTMAGSAPLADSLLRPEEQHAASGVEVVPGPLAGGEEKVDDARASRDTSVDGDAGWGAVFGI